MSGIKSEKKYTVGYWYGMGAHIVLCHGPVDNILEIKVGDKIAWSGNISQNSEITINNPELFGGDQREGGIVGHVDVMMGDENQTVNSYLKSKLGQYIPAFRGVVSLVLKHVLVSAMNPYIKPWSIRAKRILNHGSLHMLRLTVKQIQSILFTNVLLIINGVWDIIIMILITIVLNMLPKY